MPPTDLPHPDYPARSNRTHQISRMVSDKPCTLAGRVRIYGNETVLSDESGCVLLAVSESIPDHSVIEVDGRWHKNVFRVDSFRLLSSTQRDSIESRRRLFELRASVLREIRSYFDGEGYTEVETPLLTRTPGMEPHLRAFETTSETGRRLYLPTSPEYAMKRLLAEGMERIYQICKSFRDEPPATFHNPEFTMLEWYRAYADYRRIAEETEGLVSHVARRTLGTTRLTFRGTEVEVATPWERLTVRDAFARYSDISADPCADEAAFVEAARQGITTSVDENDDFDSAFFKVFLEQIEPKLGSPRPTILTEYPASMGALAKRSTENPAIAERFEIYIAGIELANAFTELNDPVEQQQRLVEESEERARIGSPPYDIDERFLDALRSGIPPSGGIALGVDRLIMLLADAPQIADVLTFPFPDI